MRRGSWAASCPNDRLHHGVKENIILLSQSEDIYNAVIKVSVPEVKFTRSPSPGRGSWIEMYAHLSRIGKGWRGRVYRTVVARLSEGR